MPGIGPKVVGAAYCPHDGHVNPLYLMRALAKGLIENGGLILTKNPLTDVKKIGDNIIVITPKEDLNVNDWYSRLV